MVRHWLSKNDAATVCADVPGIKNRSGKISGTYSTWMLESKAKRSCHVKSRMGNSLADHLDARREDLVSKISYLVSC